MGMDFQLKTLEDISGPWTVTAQVKFFFYEHTPPHEDSTTLGRCLWTCALSQALYLLFEWLDNLYKMLYCGNFDILLPRQSMQHLFVPLL